MQKALHLLKCKFCEKSGCRYGKEPALWCGECAMVGGCTLHEDINFGDAVICETCYSNITFR